jgi:hypothetical protein
VLELAIARALYDDYPILGGPPREDPLARRLAGELRGRRAELGLGERLLERGRD